MQRSCLVGLILIAAVLLAASFWLRRYLVAEPDAAPSPATPVTREGPPEAEGDAGSATRAAPTPTWALADDRVYEEQIEGLYLEAVDPLVETWLDIRGLAVVGGALYVTAYDHDAQEAWLHEVDRTAATIVRSLPLPAPDGGEPCGLQAAGPLLWTCVNTGEGALIVAVDPAAWAMAPVAPVTDTLRAVAQLADGSLVGVDRQGRRFYRWSLDGTLQKTATNATGAIYGDCALIHESLVCGGEAAGDGVLDVLDPGSLSLLARYRATTRTAWGAPVVGNGVALDGERFLFAPAGGELPLVWSYRLDGVSLAAYVPSVHALH